MPTHFVRVVVLALSLSLTPVVFAETEPATPSTTETAPSVSSPETTTEASQSSTTTVTTPAATTETAEPAPIKLSTERQALKITDDIATAEAQVRENPDDPEANFLLACAYSRSPYLDKAFYAIKKTKELLKAKKDFEFIDRSLVEYEALHKQSPFDTAITYRLAMAYYLKSYSIRKYPHHYKNGPTGDPEAFYQKALKTMEEVVELNPTDIWAKNYYGLLLTDNGTNLAKGIPVWEDSLKIDSKTNAGAYLLLAQAYMRTGDVPKALSYGAKGLIAQQATGLSLPWKQP